MIERMHRRVAAVPSGATRGPALGWLLLNAVQAGFTALWSALWISVALLLWVVTRRPRLPLRMAARLWAPGLLWGAGARLSIEGGEEVDWTGPCVVVANHRSMIDICALFRAVPVPLRFVLKRELAGVPFLGWYARAMGMVFVSRPRGAPVRSEELRLAGAAALLRGGACLAAFPEGTRGSALEVGPFKGGIFEAALAADVPVVPVAILGSGAVLPPDGFRVRPGTIRVLIGRPLRPAPEAPTPRRALAQQSRAAILELLRVARSAP